MGNATVTVMVEDPPVWETWRKRYRKNPSELASQLTSPFGRGW